MVVICDDECNPDSDALAYYEEHSPGYHLYVYLGHQSREGLYQLEYQGVVKWTDPPPDSSPYAKGPAEPTSERDD
jgi:hypothetical protein